MKQYRCNVCGWIYDPAKGDPDGGVARHPLRADPRHLVLPEVRRGQGRFRGSEVVGHPGQTI